MKITCTPLTAVCYNMEDEHDKNALDLAFNGARADDRKVWLETSSGNFEDYISTT